MTTFNASTGTPSGPATLPFFNNLMTLYFCFSGHIIFQWECCSSTVVKEFPVGTCRTTSLQFILAVTVPVLPNHLQSSSYQFQYCQYFLPLWSTAPGCLLLISSLYAHACNFFYCLSDEIQSLQHIYCLRNVSSQWSVNSHFFACCHSFSRSRSLSSLRLSYCRSCNSCYLLANLDNLIWNSSSTSFVFSKSTL